jgi:hypothetical protein
MPMTTLSFLPCARLGSGAAANAAATATMVSFFNMSCSRDLSQNKLIQSHAKG